MIQVGEPISKELRDVFNRILTIDDLMDISTEVSVSYSTIRNIYYRTQTITEENKEAAYKMMNKAFEKVENALVFFYKAKQHLEEMMPKA